MLGQISDPFAGDGVGSGYGIDENAARCRFDKTEEHANDRGFAGAVGTEQREMFALFNVKRYVVDRRNGVECFDDGIQ